MRSSRSSLNKAGAALLCAVFLLSAGCAADRVVTLPDANRELLVAVLPVENLSGGTVPLAPLRRALMEAAAGVGLKVVPEEEVDHFIREHRIRYTGGVDEEISQSLKTQLQANAVLVTSLELYNEETPPKMALMSRLVSTGERPEIIWMESVALAGDEEPGALNLGMILETKKLQEKVMERLARSLGQRLSGGVEPAGAGARYKPKVAFAAFGDQGDRKPTVAVFPFLNQSTRKNAGEMLVLHCVKQLVDSGQVAVVEPGVLRNRMLQMRIIMDDGVALPQVDLISRAMHVDYIVTGKVYEYQDYMGEIGRPKVDFSLQVIEGTEKKVVWASKSYNEGNDGVFFYDWGRTYTASALAQKMARAVVQRMLAEQ